ncbi:amino acid-binding protein [Thermovenabulum sp.]|uniref:amino acid-binding protein n=1 Tax=Thermovenabulum sp. TaxID=3100335 RepID=UPI003C79E4A9
MIVKQLSVFLENTPGRLYAVTSALNENGMDVKALMLADTADFGVLRLIVDDPEKTLKVLQERGFTVKITEVIAVEVQHTFKEVQKILEILSRKSVNIEYMYAFMGENPGKALIIFRVDNLKAAAEYLKEEGIMV